MAGNGWEKDLDDQWMTKLQTELKLVSSVYSYLVSVVFLEQMGVPFGPVVCNLFDNNHCYMNV